MERRNLFSWTMAVAAQSHSGKFHCARAVFNRMPMWDLYSWNVMLSAVHATEDLGLAIKTFDQMPERDTVSWNVMITAFARAGQLAQAFELFLWTPQRNVVSWTTMIGASSNLESESHGKVVVDAKMFFDRMPQRNVVTWTAMIHASVSTDRLIEARVLFDSMPVRNIVTWNILVAGSKELNMETMERMPMKDAVTLSTIMNWYCQAGKTSDAKTLFDQMVQRDVMVWTCLIQVNSYHIDRARFTFNLMPAWTMVSLNTMAALLASHGDLEHSKEHFDLGLERNVVSWTAVIQAFDRGGLAESAQKAFDRMPAWDDISWLAVLAAQSCNLESTKRLFFHAPARSILSWNALLTAIARSGSSIEETKTAFDLMPEHDSGSWSVLIALEAEVGSRSFFHLSPTKDTLSWEALLQGTSRYGDPYGCMTVVEKMPAVNLLSWNVALASNARSGHLLNIQKILHTMPERDAVSFGTALAAYAHSGHGADGICLFEWMLLEGIPPNDICFVHLLVACNHVGLVHEGWMLFLGMSGDHGVIPGNEHFCCMVDTLGKAGRLQQARELLECMPFEPDDVSCGSLYGSCVLHDDVEGAKRATAGMKSTSNVDYSPDIL